MTASGPDRTIGGGVIWITGERGAGKSTAAAALAAQMRLRGVSPVVLDGDVIRSAVDPEGRLSHLPRRQVAEMHVRVARLIHAQGHLVVVATVSGFHDVQRGNRETIQPYVEIYLRTTRAEAVRRTADRPVSGGDAAQEVTFESPIAPDLTLDDTFDARRASDATWLCEQVLKRLAMKPPTAGAHT